MASAESRQDCSWRWQDFGEPYLREVISESGEAWDPDGERDRAFRVPSDFLIAVRFDAVLEPEADAELTFAVQYDDGTAPFSVAEATLSSPGTVEVQWPDVSDHASWRLVALAGGRGWRCERLRFCTRHFGKRLTDCSQHEPLDAEALRHLPEEARQVAAEGLLVKGSCELLEQLYHESDLLGWGSPIHFPCFMTLWAKRQQSSDFATLVHRFSRMPGRAPILVRSGTSVEERRLLYHLLPKLLRPDAKRSLAEAHPGEELVGEALVDALWRVKRGSSLEAPPPTLEDINAKLAAAYERLSVPRELQGPDYACQFKRRDPLMLLLTKEAFGTWAPNRVFNEIQGQDIFRTYSEFTCVDGVICADDAVWMHDVCKDYCPSPDRVSGDKRPSEFFDLLDKQCPYLSQLLDEYVAQGLISPAFSTALQDGLLARPC